MSKQNDHPNSPGKPSGSGGVSSSGSACAICTVLGISCLPGCPFADHFTHTDSVNFHNACNFYGVDYVQDTLTDIADDPDSWRFAVTAMIHDANARLQDPVGGCLRIVQSLQHQLAAAQLELQRLARQYPQPPSGGIQISKSSTTSQAGQPHHCDRAADFQSSGNPSGATASAQGGHILGVGAGSGCLSVGDNNPMQNLGGQGQPPQLTAQTSQAQESQKSGQDKSQGSKENSKE